MPDEEQVAIIVQQTIQPQDVNGLKAFEAISTELSLGKEVSLRLLQVSRNQGKGATVYTLIGLPFVATTEGSVCPQQQENSPKSESNSPPDGSSPEPTLPEQQKPSTSCSNRPLPGKSSRRKKKAASSGDGISPATPA